MNSIVKTILVVLAVLLVAGALLVAGFVFGRPAVLLGGVAQPAYAFDREYDGFAPGMMRGWNGPGMMQSWRGGGRSHGMMGNWGGGMGPGMMGPFGWGIARDANLTPPSIEEAKQAADKYVQSVDVDGLQTAEIMIFDNQAYIVVEESGSGLGAFELLLDAGSRVVYPEPGPNMMWNLKYGALNHQRMMGGHRGMMGIWSTRDLAPADVSPDMPVSQDEAAAAAQTYLDQYRAGATVSDDPVQFYGYYTFDFEQDGQVAGMLSVNGHSSQVFLHTWHGAFIEETH